MCKSITVLLNYLAVNRLLICIIFYFYHFYVVNHVLPAQSGLLSDLFLYSVQ